MDILYIVLAIISIFTTIGGLYALGEKYKSGFMLYNISLGCQIYLFCVAASDSIIVRTIIFIQLLILFVFNFRNFFKWRGEDICQSKIKNIN
jgi:hypothetical protein